MKIVYDNGVERKQTTIDSAKGKKMETMTLKDKVILGFYDDIDEANELKTACCFESDDEERYDEAIRRAIELAKEDGLWEEIKYLSPEDQLIETQTQYPELFE